MSISQMTGTPWHVETLHRDDERRHKSRCVHYDQGRCTYATHCGGSSHCSLYQEELTAPTTKQTLPSPSTFEKRNHPKSKNHSANGSATRITLHHTVELYDYEEKKLITVSFGAGAPDLGETNKYQLSPESALAKELIGRSQGDIVSVNQFKYKVNKVT